MPQMSPSWWMLILIMTTISVMYTISVKFHNKENKMYMKNIKKTKINWKW
uniref:ATP synthase F0 subunit 8 n=1 Tax=Cladolidia biungulata TaxID=2983421 RepID=A0A977TLF4_9HEMI|nr:ATP synthase F0 subunit 8 [Cladolidia biungulata]UXW93597.1 ATP synthase F0 subunit 8 [Cladolidia biungulata]